MDSLIVPDLALLRRWLDQLGISFFECDSCQALHLPHMQNFEGVFDAKVDLVDNVILFSALAEIRPTALIPLVADLSQINASSLTAKAFIDIQDDNLPKLIVCQSVYVTHGMTLEQFGYFMQQSEEQVSMIILEARANDLLFIGETEEDEGPIVPTSFPVIH
ncbi:bacterial sensory transduction regulator family protein [Yersinia ruckeri]|uniref:YbjN domain-containing protein n=1 Tax=Yersinia ruckeri TaxID=29486 RepID=UPI0005ACE570|nr:YbjN domain-containing protein [Yersinia ruckeri]AJI95959.1 bacterial sensory transduction regulator family protein [Yersinia ruckeri]MCW6567928.1 YbjN domain-containing protein [Yersinia ruckeri]